jgi:DNA-binding NarL/FixJ family response regulator
MIRCIAIDDDILYLTLLKSYFAEYDQIELVGAYLNPVDGIMEVVKQKPDVLLIDKEMPYLDGMETLSTLDHTPKVIMISAHLDQPRNLSELRIDKYLRKVSIKNADHLRDAIEAVFNG